MKISSIIKLITAATAIMLLAGVVASPAMATLPIATTEPATNVAATTATLQGTVKFEASVTRVGFSYRVKGTETFDHHTPLEYLTEGSPKKISAAVYLEPATTYEFQINSLSLEPAGNSQGEILTFTTKSLQPARFEAGAYPASLSGVQTFSKMYNEYNFQIGTPLECSKASLSGFEEGPTTSSSLFAEYTGCEVSGIPVTVNMNSCYYTLSLNGPGPSYPGKWGIKCSAKGDSIKLVYKSSGIPICTASIPAQSPGGSVTMTNVGAGSTAAVHAFGSATGVEFDASGELCFLFDMEDGKHSTNGKLGVNTTLSALNKGKATGFFITGGSSPVGLYLAGEKSETPSAQPHVVGQAYPIKISGPNVSSQFTFAGGLAVNCKSATLNGGSQIEAVQALNFSATYGACDQSGTETSISMNSCYYTFTLNNSGPPYAGSYGVGCSKGGDSIKVNLSESACILRIPAQSAAGSINAVTEGAGSARKVHATGTATGVKYTSSGELCFLWNVGEAGSYTNGKFSIDALLTGTYQG